MKESTRNVVSVILLIPTTVVSVLCGFLFLLLASVGASLSVLFGALMVVWAANFAMWCIFVRNLREKSANSTPSMVRRWLYYLIIGADLSLIGFAVKDPEGSIWVSMALAWVALTLVYFGFMNYRTPPAEV